MASESWVTSQIDIEGEEACSFSATRAMRLKAWCARHRPISSVFALEALVVLDWPRQPWRVRSGSNRASRLCKMLQ